jgi:broad specificity phosphatase PhoE
VSRLILVRHGQASAGSDDYDQLSERGYEQARRLGEQWAAEGLVPDSVYIGPRKRHRQTAETAAELGRAWPEPVYLDDWDEHAAYDVVMHSLPILAEADGWVAERVALCAGDGKDAQRAYFDLYRHVTRLWVRGELPLDGTPYEPWPVFRDRVERALAETVEREGRGRTVVIVTSSGPVSVAAGRALGLDDEGMMALSWNVQNIAVTEVLYDGNSIALKTFNALPRLVGDGLQTLI